MGGPVSHQYKDPQIYDKNKSCRDSVHNHDSFRVWKYQNKDFLFEEGFFDLNISSFDSVTETIADSKLMKLDDLPFRRYRMSICLPIP